MQNEPAFTYGKELKNPKENIKVNLQCQEHFGSHSWSIWLLFVRQLINLVSDGLPGDFLLIKFQLDFRLQLGDGYFTMLKPHDKVINIEQDLYPFEITA